MPAGDPVTGKGAANWSRINNGVRDLIAQTLVSHLLVHALESTESLRLEGIKSVTADPVSLADMEAPSDHRPVIARFNLSSQILLLERSLVLPIGPPCVQPGRGVARRRQQAGAPRGQRGRLSSVSLPARGCRSGRRSPLG
jgi:hypothetical protein